MHPSSHSKASRREAHGHGSGLVGCKTAPCGLSIITRHNEKIRGVHMVDKGIHSEQVCMRNVWKEAYCLVNVIREE